MILTDKLAYTSKIRNKSPFIKTLVSVFTLILCILSRSWKFSLIILGFMGYSTVKYSRVSLKRYLKFMIVPGSFLILSSIALVFDISNEPLGIFNLAIGNRYIIAMKGNIFYGIELILTALSSVSCLYFLSVTTPMQDLIIVMRKLKIPKLVVEIMFLMYRFIFIIGEMAHDTIIAENCRLGNRGIKAKIKDMGLMLSTVFVRSYHKANGMFEAMEARNYNGEISVLWEHEKGTTKEKIIVCIYFIIVMGLAFVCH